MTAPRLAQSGYALLPQARVQRCPLHPRWTGTRTVATRSGPSGPLTKGQSAPKIPSREGIKTKWGTILVWPSNCLNEPDHLRHRVEHRDDSPVVHVEMAPGIVTIVPAWMLDPAICAGLEIGMPQVTVSALVIGRFT